MNCANHADASAVAYCRTCGKALCANCTRPVKGVIYCEDCLGAKMEGTVPPAAAFAPAAVSGSSRSAAAPAPGSGPNPTVAGILAGFFPIGVGAVYNGQYSKGLAHLLISALLFYGLDNAGSAEGLFVAGWIFFWVYQIVDSVRSAKAIQVGAPPPDPFGLAQTFGVAQKMDARKVPTGAVVLIVLGILFLLHTAGLFEVGFRHFWPVLLILLGGWMLASRWGLLGATSGCRCERCRTRCLMGPAILMTIGVVALIGSFRDVGFFGYVGAILLVIGGVKLFEGGASAEGHRSFPDPGLGPAAGGGPAMPPAPPSEVSHG